MSDDLSCIIEAVLFHKAEATKIKELAGILEVSEENVRAALSELETKLQGRGVQLVKNDDEVMLGTTPETAVVIEKLIREELDKDLGKAGLETLSIVLYKGPVSRSEIDYIRGVNSSYILRTMIMRGLVERVNDVGKKTFMYRPTFELLAYLGVSSVDELPEYAVVQEELASLMTDEDVKNEREIV